MKQILFTLALAQVALLVLGGCITESETTQKDVNIDPACVHYDSTTWTDTTEVNNSSCTVKAK